MEEKPSAGALRAARALRIKIHCLQKGKGSQGADNPSNSKWLDRQCPDDARIIDRETAAPDLLEALKSARDTLSQCFLSGDTGLPGRVERECALIDAAITKARAQ